MNHEIKPVATFNDLVTADGYGSDLFVVEAYYYEYHHEPDGVDVDVVYDLTCVHGSSGYIIAGQDDLTLACRAEKAEEFLQAYKPAPTKPVRPTRLLSELYYAIGNGGIDMTKKTAEVAKEKVLTKRERIDALLDERNTVGVTDGWINVADDGYKQRRLDEIDAKIREVQAE